MKNKAMRYQPKFIYIFIFFSMLSTMTYAQNLDENLMMMIEGASSNRANDSIDSLEEKNQESKSQLEEIKDEAKKLDNSYLKEFQNLPYIQQRELIDKAKQLAEFQLLSIEQKESLLGTIYNQRTSSELLTDPLESNVILEFIKPFGYGLFSDESSTFITSENFPIPGDYIVGVGDSLTVTTFGKENKKYETSVTSNGDVSFGGVGPILVSGMTLEEMAQSIKDVVSVQKPGVRASIRLGKLRSIPIYILGDVKTPGQHLVSALSSVTNALFLTGGIDNIGSLRNIDVKRRGELIARVDLYDLLIKGDSRNDITLQRGDVIFVPPKKMAITIAGQVRRQAVYEVLEEDSLEDLIRYAGGLKSDADRDAIQLQRSNRNGTINIIEYAYSEISQGFKLQDGDVINVLPMAKKFDDVVQLSGFFKRPGLKQWQKGLKLSDVLISYKELLPSTDRNYILIRREANDGTIYPLQFTAEDIFQNGAQDPDLMPRDQIFLFTNRAQDTQKEVEEEEETSFAGRVLEKNLGEELLSEDDKQQKEIQEQEELKKKQKYNRFFIMESFVAELKDQATSQNPSKLVTIAGNVRFPGEYPLSESMNIMDAVNAAGGLEESSYAAEIELTSIDLRDKAYSTNRSIYDFSNSSEMEMNLETSDLVFVKAVPKEIQEVEILGDVYFPGSYIAQENETLSDLITRAGGLKPTAFIEGSIFTRESIREKERERITQAQEILQEQILLARNSGGLGQSEEGGDNTGALMQSVSMAKPTGRLVIDLSSIIKGSSDDIILQDQDRIFIPKNTQTVSVIGEVYVPTNHVFMSGNNVTDYIEKSGGFTDFASNENVYIIKADGSIITGPDSGFFRGASDRLEYGDTIVVPLDVSQFSTLKAATDITQIIYQLGVAAAAVSSFTN
ncbi:SLBB domain-containing protein [Gammaproteobacteria bacterium]|nr:SLBB domain-containing protein [Gammaproteobacteria bacterium]